MAKFRQNHSRVGKRPFSGMLTKTILFFVAIALIFIVIYRSFNSAGSTNGLNDSDIGRNNQLIPEGHRNEVVSHDYYTLGYNEKYEQAEWAVYELTKESLRIPNVPRSNRFGQDPMVSTNSVKHRDYSGSGYTRGHLVPAGDMAFSTEAMQQSFFMSNMSPQISGFNGGIWRELEESVRDWAYENESIYVATGPILDEVTEYIGKESKIGVPQSFYKIIVDLSGREKKGIAFVLPHAISEKPLMDYAVSIDQVEDRLNLDFFDNLYGSSNEEKNIESSIDKNKWPLSSKRYDLRINNWNRN